MLAAPNVACLASMSQQSEVGESQTNAHLLQTNTSSRWPTLPTRRQTLQGCHRRPSCIPRRPRNSPVATMHHCLQHLLPPGLTVPCRLPYFRTCPQDCQTALTRAFHPLLLSQILISATISPSQRTWICSLQICCRPNLTQIPAATILMPS